MQPTKLARLLKIRVILIMTFYKFYRDFKKFKRMSLGSKYDDMNDFYTLLNETETKNRKNRIMSNVNQLYNKYVDTYKNIMMVKR